MKHIFGPVPSRRLGQSLGIDPVPLKTCNWNCVYCQLGRSKPMVNKRADYYPPKAILSEAKEALAGHEPGGIDWVTFVGSGETTLHASMGWLIRQVKMLTHLPVAVITNGALLYCPELRRELRAADAVLPSLDAGTPALYKQINRPHPSLSFERLLNGLKLFRREYSGKLWVEVMLLRGLNDTESALRDIAAALETIQPDEVQIVQPTRPPAEIWVQPPDEEGLLRARAILGEMVNIVPPACGDVNRNNSETLIDAVAGIITRHPMRAGELAQTLRKWSEEEIMAALADLENSGRAKVVERYGTRFWSASNSHYAESGA